MKIPIRLTIDMDYEWPTKVDGVLDQHTKWHLEENHCINNVIRKLADGLRDGFCTSCSRGKVEVVERELFEEEEA